MPTVWGTFDMYSISKLDLSLSPGAKGGGRNDGRPKGIYKGKKKGG
jgi:hypothetical protein